MRIIGLLILVLSIVSCTEGQVEELAFRKTLEYDLIKLCGDADKECVNAVKTQIKGCMEKSKWRNYLENQDSEDELNRFIKEFYSCIVDSQGNTYFQPNA